MYRAGPIRCFRTRPLSGRTAQGVSYVHQEHEPANLYIRLHSTHQSTTGPLPCTIEAITRSGTDTPSSRPTGPFFTQRRSTGFLGSSQVRSSRKSATASNALATVGMVYLGDAPATSRDL